MNPKAPGNISQASLLQKVEVLNFHNYKLSQDPKHKQSQTIKHFKELNLFPISKSSFNRWVNSEKKLREEALKLTYKDKRKTKTRKSRIPENTQLSAFFAQNKLILKCIELSIIQDVVSNMVTDITNNVANNKFSEFNELMGGSLHNADVAWQTKMKQDLSILCNSLIDDIKFQENINKEYNSLSSERRRIREGLAGYERKDIYELDEILFDLSYLYNLTSFPSEDILQSQLDDGSLTGNMNGAKFVTLGVCCNLSGTQFLRPLIVSNVENTANVYNSNLVQDYYYYSSDGLNTREALQSYLTFWDTQLAVDGGKVALILDTYWCHLGLNSFSNIKVVYTNSKFDRVTSYYHRTQFRLPMSYGFSRLIKSRVKISLFKKIYSITKIKRFDDVDGIDLINHMRIGLNVIIDLFKEERYQLIMKLCVHASKIFIEKEDSEDGITESKLSTYIKENKLSDLGIQFSEARKEVYLKEEEKALHNFVKTLTRSIAESNPDMNVNKNELSQLLAEEFTSGRNEKKFNKIYSNFGILNLAKAQIEHAKKLESAITVKQDFHSSKAFLKIDKFLSVTLQPALSHNFNPSYGGQESKEKIQISDKTMSLFNLFYDSYINDTVKIKPKEKNRTFDLSMGSRKKPKSNPLIDMSEDISDSLSESNEGVYFDASDQSKKDISSSGTFAYNSIAKFRDAFSESD